MTVIAHQTGSDPAWSMPHAPRVAARARIARALFLRAVRGLPLRVVLPDGASVGGGGPDAPMMRIERDAFFHRLAAAPHGRFAHAEQDLGRMERPAAELDAVQVRLLAEVAQPPEFLLQEGGGLSLIQGQ